ncbi:MAG: nucleotidyl transferase AbiEii/AbiGii toxin family protein [Candidatus Magasanikbacteria bacterium]|nr:nucleotidyl transferase AbiEii/AbiGii toxin family protein [Candidatus Magasanikbacteria bacterium]
MTITPLSSKAKKLLIRFDTSPWLKNFYLAGGTALALYYGHRQSVDLDWFSQKPINTKQLIRKLAAIGTFTLLKEETNMVDGILDGVKVSFMTYPYPLLEKTKKLHTSLRLASLKDIAVMKAEAIAGRNTKKDFIDVYTYLHREQSDLQNLFLLIAKKFKAIHYDFYHLCKSFVYFVDANKEPMPRMIEKIDWKTIKKFFIKEIKKITVR